MTRFSLFPALAAALALAAPAEAQHRPARADVWDLEPGKAAAELPADFAEFACGGNGGPPSLPLRGFADFRRCRAEESGLREVYFRYDDELEYWAKAQGLATEIEQYSGTKEYGFPVILSALFDEAGALAGLRIVSDARDASRKREDAHTLRNFLTARFGRDGWDCLDHPPEDGETPVGRTFIKQTCRKTLGSGAVVTLETRYFRKRGQEAFDARSGRETQGQFESLARFELRSATQRPPARPR